MTKETSRITEAPPSSARSGQAPQPAGEHFKVLLIEDNPGDARLIQLMLADAGDGLFEVETVDRLAAGLRRLSRNDIGLVLLDLSLPDSQGLETFTHLHA